MHGRRALDPGPFSQPGPREGSRGVRVWCRLRSPDGARRAAELGAARRVHSFCCLGCPRRSCSRAGRSAVPRRRRRSGSPTRRRVLRRLAAGPKAAAHDAVHDWRFAQGPWPRVAFEEASSRCRWRVVCARCGRAAAQVPAWAGWLRGLFPGSQSRGPIAGPEFATEDVWSYGRSVLGLERELLLMALLLARGRRSRPRADPAELSFIGSGVP